MLLLKRYNEKKKLRLWLVSFSKFELKTPHLPKAVMRRKLTCRTCESLVNHKQNEEGKFTDRVTHAGQIVKQQLC